MAEGTKKIFAGARIRNVRLERGMTQAELARKLSISTSYLNQIENNQRSLSAAVILSLVDEFDFDLSGLLMDGSGKVSVELQEVLNDPVFAENKVLNQELKAAANTAPNLAEAFLHLYKVFQNTRMQLGRLDTSLPGLEASITPQPYEEVRDYFHRHDNYIDELDRAAEAFSGRLTGAGQGPLDALAQHLEKAHGVTISLTDDGGGNVIRRFDERGRRLYLSQASSPATNLFQMAYQVGLLEQKRLMETLLDQAGFHTSSAREVCRMTFANYFAGAVLLPYARFADAAREARHDIDRLALRFGASREQIAHRLSMLQRPGHKGVPFFFVRVDRAGTVTKRHSATAFQFTRFGASCPRWNVHQAFATGQEILRQLAVTSDGIGYLCLAFSKAERRASFDERARYYAIGLGCEVAHADQIVYADDLDTKRTTRFEPIGASCRICEWRECSHRSIPPLTHRISINHNARQAVPFEIE
ncbi:helix-turn-helix domain-containing protein [Albidovulum sediminicola]|uniref:Short-chain fatty acyl-CoA regulator family protein n=1 Tax=Albidovulum sediminicola TaxID=2984331 RepID=A0ABT2Z4M9_9RHOB|nr:helix-turn-helix transcriptional regulator [Defluviimonas sp. WL0075]MCV2865975.1 short-chain fatty acyl-CoA regulator family protein [Defluviimonas sp. WL0075]